MSNYGLTGSYVWTNEILYGIVSEIMSCNFTGLNDNSRASEIFLGLVPNILMDVY